MSILTGLFVALGLFTAYFLVIFVREVLRARKAGEPVAPTTGAFIVGTIANFFDTLGIGSFATTTTAFRSFKMVPDEMIPGTLNVGYALAALFQSVIFIAAVEVDPMTLVLMIGSAVAGAYLGAGVFASWPRRKIQFGMGGALLVAGLLFIYKNAVGDPIGGLATGLTGITLVLGMAGNFALGILMTIGIGLYGPCMLLVAMLGMSPRTAFPIMMASCAFLMPVASTRFLRVKAAHIPVSVGLALSALPGVYLAWKFFSTLDIKGVRWIVAIVVLYTGIMLLRTAIRERPTTA